MTTSIECQERQREEIENLEAIFGPAWVKYQENSETYRVALERHQQNVELEITFTDGYPIHNRIKYVICAPWLRGKDREILINELENTIKKHENEPVIYELVQTIYDFLNGKFTVLANDNSDRSDEHAIEVENEEIAEKHIMYSKRLIVPSLSPEEVYSCPDIFTDKPIEEDATNIFQAHCAHIQHECQIEMVLNQLKQHKKIENAKHNVFAYRIINKDGKIISESNDGGESRAGEWVLEPLVHNNLTNIMVVVTRWHRDYAKHMGSKRFTLYKECCVKIIKNFLQI